MMLRMQLATFLAAIERRRAEHWNQRQTDALQKANLPWKTDEVLLVFVQNTTVVGWVSLSPSVFLPFYFGINSENL